MASLEALLADGVDNSGGHPSALILPSTTAVIGEVDRMRESVGLTVVGGSTQDRLPPSVLLKAMARSGNRPLLLIFTDQIMSPADASILIKTNDAEAFFSPLEFILNSRYGYRLVIWKQNGYTAVEPGSSISEVFAPIADHLQHCCTLGDEWLERKRQYQRNPTTRRFNALRKLRFFRSNVINAYCTEPATTELAELLQQIVRMEQKVAQEHAV